MKPKTKAGMLVCLVTALFGAFLLTQGTAEKVLFAFFCPGMLGIVVPYVVLTVVFLRMGNPAYRP